MEQIIREYNVEFVFTGKLHKVLFHSQDNDYLVAVFRTNEAESFTICGYLPEPSLENQYKLKGCFGIHKKYGEQFRFESFEILIPKTEDGLALFLSSGIIKGIGPKLADQLIDHFGKGIMGVLENNPERLLEVKGIGKRKQQQIEESFRQGKERRDFLYFCSSNGISAAQANRIFKSLGEKSLALVKQNPYRLIEEVHGIGFKKADQIAMSLGAQLNDPPRLEAIIFYALEEGLRNGDCYLLKEALSLKFAELAQLENYEYDFEQALGSLIDEESIILVQDQDIRIYLKSILDLEMHCADKVVQISSAKIPKSSKTDQIISEISEDLSITLSKQQTDSIRKIMGQSFSILSGGPGTGKSTIIKLLVRTLEASELSYCLAAPTGMAAKRLAAATTRNAVTIHRLLEFNPVSGSWERNKANPLKADFIIIDEFSMVDLYVFSALLDAIDKGTQVVLVGDPDQLPSVGPGRLLCDLIECALIPVMRLDFVYRQGPGSSISKNARSVLNSQYFDSSESSDFQFLNVEDRYGVRDQILDLVSNIIPSEYGFDAKDIQVLSPMKKGPMGTESLNQLIASRLNPGERIKCSSIELKVGDKILQTSNNYELEIYNGDIGHVMAINREEEFISADFKDHYVDIPFEDCDQLLLAYAITVHKSQGNEYPVVLMPYHSSHYIMLRKNLIYTGITRAKKLMILVGDKRASDIVVSSPAGVIRNSSLKLLIQHFEKE